MNLMKKRQKNTNLKVHKITTKKLKKQVKGITLIALVVTIIVLLILAGVALSLTVGDNGLLRRAQNAADTWQMAEQNEQSEMDEVADFLERYENKNKPLESVTGEETTNSIVYDKYGNKVVVPSGFKIINPKDDVTKGIVIEDINAGNEYTKGSQFVWIPVGTIHSNRGDVTINFNRYNFEDDGTEIGQGTNPTRLMTEVGNEIMTNTYYCLELESSTENTTAKDINTFISKVIESKGYYIGRYEARTSMKRTDSDNILTPTMVKKENYVYNFVTQSQAAHLSRNMYEESRNFTSDLVNSYAWDTALVFIQKCSNNKNYSRLTSINTELEEFGTGEDEICNIYDMASNCCELSTEYCRVNESSCCVARGGYYSNAKYYTSSRNGVTSSGSERITFRTILYL